MASLFFSSTFKEILTGQGRHLTTSWTSAATLHSFQTRQESWELTCTEVAVHETGVSHPAQVFRAKVKVRHNTDTLCHMRDDSFAAGRDGEQVEFV
jgi:hypothetical protein